MKAKKYLLLFAVSVAITLIILALTGFDVLVNYSNALFVTGAIFIAGAIMSVVTYHGGFDTFGYSGHALVYSFRPEKGKKYNDMYEYVQVKTVKKGKYKEYDITNAFYEKLGFKELECFPNLWDEWNPCQVYVKYIAGDAQEK